MVLPGGEGLPWTTLCLEASSLGAAEHGAETWLSKDTRQHGMFVTLSMNG